jgi:bidirectional [NiFe] hydrogenase diaphorase subunit
MSDPPRAAPRRTAPEWSSATITLTVDDRLVSARQGDTLLTVARQEGVSIPTLCELEGLSLVGACRLCLVEIVGRPRLAAACVTAAEEGMQVLTNTERLHRYRQMTIELLFAERNHICSVCVANGNCELQSLAAGHGVDHVRFDYLSPGNLAVDASHDLFVLDHNRCVLCTRCVRVCDEVEGAHTWDLSGRGGETRVITDMATPWGESITCTSCGKCVQACPTGALAGKGSTVAEMEKDRQKLSFLARARGGHRWELDLVSPGGGDGHA